MKKIWVTLILVTIISTGMWCRKPADFPEENTDYRLSGGAATTFLSNSQAFGEMITGLSSYDQLVHERGDGLFEQTFVSAPAPHFQGLGTLFNNVSCISCHHNDGKGTPTMGTVQSSLLTRISIPGTDPNGGPLAAPGFGTQLQDKSNNGPAETSIQISYEEIPFTFTDGETVSLRKPTYTIASSYISLPPQYMISVRLAPPVFGLGLLELVPESSIVANTDPEDENHDGIKGKANYVYDPFTQKKELGRFGLKANTPSIQIQVAGAFQEDMGVTNYVFPRENSYGQIQYKPSDYGTDINDTTLNDVVFYIRTLAVPARRDATDSIALRGEKIFSQIKCSSCHLPSLRTGVDVRLPALSNQLIHPYTDLLLHDMGPGLADGRPDYLANGNEWRTAPLWGVGLFPKTNGKAYYLHDGRARTLTEAILWHGGEAEASKDRFAALTKQDRDALIKFLSSL